MAYSPKLNRIAIGTGTGAFVYDLTAQTYEGVDLGYPLDCIRWIPGMDVFVGFTYYSNTVIPVISDDGKNWTRLLNRAIAGMQVINDAVWAASIGLLTVCGYGENGGLVCATEDLQSWRSFKFNDSAVTDVKSVAWSASLNMFVAFSSLAAETDGTYYTMEF